MGCPALGAERGRGSLFPCHGGGQDPLGDWLLEGASHPWTPRDQEPVSTQGPGPRFPGRGRPPSAQPHGDVRGGSPPGTGGPALPRELSR